MRNFPIQKWKRLLLGLFPLLIFIGISIYFFVNYDPNYITEFIGINNAYLLIFITAFIGGLTTFNIVPYHLLLITLATSGELNPLLLGCLAATGVSIGDSTSYFIGYQGKTILPERMGKWFVYLHSIAKENPKKFMALCFLYSAIIPESNDLITIPAGLARVPFFMS